MGYGLYLKESANIVNRIAISAGFDAFSSVLARVFKGTVLIYIPSTGSETFPSSYRSTHVVEQLDKAIAEITDIKRDSPTYHIEYELNRTKSTAKSKQGKVISITFTVEWETDSDSM